MISGNGSFLDVQAAHGWTPRVTSCNDGTIVFIGPGSVDTSHMAVGAGHVDTRFATGIPGLTALERKIHPVLDIGKIKLSGPAPGFHTRGARPTAGQRLVLSGTGVNAPYGTPAPEPFFYATRELRSGYGRATYQNITSRGVMGALENPANVDSFQPSVVGAVHDSGGGMFDTSGNLLAVMTSVGGANGEMGWGYPSYSDDQDSGTTGHLVEFARDWLDRGYDAVSIAIVELRYQGEPEAPTSIEARIYASNTGSWTGPLEGVCLNINGSPFRSTTTPTLGTDERGQAFAAYALTAGGTLPAAGCCNVAAGLFTRSSDSAATAAVTNLAYHAYRVWPAGGGGVSLGTPQLRPGGIRLRLRNNAGDMGPSTIDFDREVTAVTGPTVRGLVFRGPFNEGLQALADTVNPANPTQAQITVSSSWSTGVVAASAEHIGTPASRGVININNLSDAFVVDAGDGSAPNAAVFDERPDQITAPEITLTGGAGSTGTAISRSSTIARYHQVVAAFTGTLDVTPSGTAFDSGTYAVAVCNLNSVAPLTPIPGGSSTNAPLAGCPVVAGGRYLVAVQNTNGASRTVAFSVLNTEVIPPAAAADDNRSARTSRICRTSR